MSERKETSISGSRVFLGSLIALFGFGLLVAFVIAAGPGESSIDRTKAGDFDEATTEARWNNLKEVSAAQETAVDSAALKKAVADVIKKSASSKAAKTELVVPGSPTFLKQAPAPAAPADAKTDAPADAETDAPAADAAPEAKAQPAPDSAPKADSEETPKKGKKKTKDGGKGASQKGKGAKGEPKTAPASEEPKQ